MASVNASITTSPILSELERMPLIRLLEAWEANPWTAISLAFMAVVQKERERLVKPVGNGLQRGCWSICSSGTRKNLVQIVAVGQRLRLMVVLLGVFQHRVVRLPCFHQAVLQPILLLLGWIQAIRKRSHVSNYTSLTVRGRGCLPSISVKPYSKPNAAATNTWPDFCMICGSAARAVTARPINCGDSELDRSK